MMKSKISIWIPIDLSNRQEIAAALERKYGTEYVFVDGVFQSTINNERCEVTICDRQTWKELNQDLNLADDFQLAGQDKLDVSTLKKIERCRQIICLTSNDTGYAACLQIARLAQVLLLIGGIAIKVDSAGIAHHRDKWLTNYDSDDVFEIYTLFVMLLEGEDYYYSCGMHNFGKADVAINIGEDIGLAIYVMNVFNYYRLTESPILQDGHTFQPDIQCPRYQIKWIADEEYATVSYQYNSHGRWLLTVHS